MCLSTKFVVALTVPQTLVSPPERQWAHSKDLLLVHPEQQTDSFLLYLKGTIMICMFPIPFSIHVNVIASVQHASKLSISGSGRGILLETSLYHHHKVFSGILQTQLMLLIPEVHKPSSNWTI